MADRRDERGNPIYLTDEQGKPAQLVDEFGNVMHLTGVATTVPHLKESSYTGPHPITAPITTTDTPHHAQPISVSHNPLENIGISSSNSMDEYGQGSRQGANVTDETKSKVEGHDPSTATVSGSGSEEAHEKKGFLKKIKEKISGNHNDPYTTSPHLFSEEAEKAFARVRDKVKMPLYGCDCYAYALLASGLVDLVIESSLTPYDFLALVPVIEGAGGTITDWNGNSLLWEASSSAFATSFNVVAAGDSDIHQQALESLKWQ